MWVKNGKWMRGSSWTRDKVDFLYSFDYSFRKFDFIYILFLLVLCLLSINSRWPKGNILEFRRSTAPLLKLLIS